MGKPLRVLIVEDSEPDSALLLIELGRAGYAVTSERVETAEQMAEAIQRAEWDLVLSDYMLPSFDAPAALRIMKQNTCNAPFIIISGTVGEEAAVASLKGGAHDFLVKGRLARLGPAIARELRDAQIRKDHARLEEQLRQSQKMEAVGQLAGGVAHDFNNMLTAILGYTEMLTEQIDADKPLGRDLREIKAAAERAATLTKQLLAFSRMQALEMTPVNLTEMVRNVEPMLRRLLEERVTFRTLLADDLHPVLADTTQLEHILINLAVNARDAMPKGGVLTAKTRNVEVDAAFAATHPGARIGSYAMLSVSDTGVGMSPDVLKRIFEPFFTTKKRGRGTGLGLAAAYGTVKQLGGYIAVDSQPGRGSTFAVYLPKTERAMPEPAAPTALTGVPPGTETILMVEDEAGVRAFVKAALRRFGYKVLEADSGEAALALLEHIMTPIHLLLTDIVLPGMDGRELAAGLSRSRPDLRVLLMSGYADNWSDTIAASPRTVHHIEKPFTAQALLVKVRHALDYGSFAG